MFGNRTSVRILAACSIGSFFALSTLIVYPFGLFAIAIARDAHWSNVTTTGLIGPALLIIIPAQPVVGWIVGRFEKRLVAICAMAALALALMLLAAAPLIITWFEIVLALAILLASLATPAIYSAILTKEFDRRRGLALGFVLSFAGLGVALLPLLMGAIIQNWGWRSAYGLSAGLAALGAVVVALLLPTRSARQNAEFRVTTPSAGGDESFFKGTTFWSIAAIFLLVAVAANAVPLHLPLILRERGATIETSAASLSIMGVTMIVGRPAIGFLLDILPIRVVLAITISGPLAGSLALLTTDGPFAALFRCDRIWSCDRRRICLSRLHGLACVRRAAFRYHVRLARNGDRVRRCSWPNRNQRFAPSRARLWPATYDGRNGVRVGAGRHVDAQGGYFQGQDNDLTVRRSQAAVGELFATVPGDLDIGAESGAGV